MENPSKFVKGQDAEEQGEFVKAWNDPNVVPTTRFSPESSTFERGEDVQSEAEGTIGETVSDIKDKAGQAAETVQEKAHNLTDQAHSMSDKGIDSAAAGLGQAASMLRQQGESHQGTLGSAAARTADTLEQASTFLQDKDTDQLVSDIEAMVRKRPVESVLVAAGIGYLLSKVFS